MASGPRSFPCKGVVVPQSGLSWIWGGVYPVRPVAGGYPVMPVARG